MMPEVGAVLDAARRLALGGPEDIQSWDALANAVEALDARLASAGGPPYRVEQDRTWGEAVVGDEILSARTNRWYEVHSSVRTPDGNMKVMIKGNAKPITRPAKDPVRIKRGLEGEAVDIVEVLFSGSTAPAQTPARDAVPILMDKVEDDDE